ncbi:MAG: glycosyltransferase family 39 protein [Pseudomonadota bacterium]
MTDQASISGGSRRPFTATPARAQFLAILGVLLAVIAIAYPSLFVPFGRDQGIHANIAKLVQDGLVVYRDIFNVKPPMTTVIHWLSQRLFGETVQAIRLMDIVIIAAACVMLQLLVSRHLKSAWLGVVAAIAYACFHFSNGYWSSAQTDGWCGFFTIAAMLAYSHALDREDARGRLWLLALAGFAIGLSFWLKYTSALVKLVIPAVHLAMGAKIRRILRVGAAVTAGLLLCICGGIAVLAAQGALVAFLDIQDFMRSYVAHGQSILRIALWPFFKLAGAKMAAILAMLGTYAVFKSIQRRKQVPECIGLLVWLAAGCASGMLQGKLFTYHMLPFHPPLAVAAAVGVSALVAFLGRRTKHHVKIPIALCASLLIVWFSEIPKKYNQVLPLLRGEQSLRAFWDIEEFNHFDFKTTHNMALVDYLRRETLACDTVYLWGFEPGVYFKADRRPVTRFTFNFPMFSAFYRQSYRDEFMADLRAAPPVAFIVEHDDRTPHVSIHNKDSAEVLEEFGELKAFLSDRFIYRERVTRFDVYFRNDVAGGDTRSCPPSPAS